jgi:hypothetical protein
MGSLLPAPARADSFDDLRRTFQTDIPHFFQSDVPHFFQDDIPCAFGGKPTSGAKTSCNSPPAKKAKPVTKQNAAPKDPLTTGTVMKAPRDTTIEQNQLAPPAAASNPN